MKELQPPWARFPDIPCGSIGWRMGNAEGYLHEWGHWFAAHAKDNDWKLRYFARHRVAPRPWADFVVNAFLGFAAFDDEGVDVRPIVELVEVNGLVGDDVAFDAWIAACGGTPIMPGTKKSRLDDLGRLSIRAMSFWGRWIARERAGGRLDAKTPALLGHAALREAALSGRVPKRGPLWRKYSNWELLALELAADGVVAPPWLSEGVPTLLRNESSDAFAWAHWVRDCIDDKYSWHRYLALYEPMPTVWSAAIEQHAMRMLAMQ